MYRTVQQAIVVSEHWKCRDAVSLDVIYTGATENAGVEKAGVSRYGKPNKKINRGAAHSL